MQKMSARSIPIFPANLATFEFFLIFGVPFVHLWTPVVPKRDIMWCEILQPSFFLAHCASFMSRWSLLGGRSLQIRSWETIHVVNDT